MRIGLDAKLFGGQSAGIGRYAVNLIRGLVAVAGPEIEQWVLFCGPQTDGALLREMPERCRIVRSAASSSLLRSLIALPVSIAREGVDLFHGLDHVGLPLRGRPVPSVLTVHDTFPIDHPEWFTAKHRAVVRFALPRAVRRATRVITPSRAVKDSLLRLGWIDADRIDVVPEGCEERFSPAAAPLDDLRRRYGLPRRFVLFVGTAEPRKNLSRLLRAFAALPNRDVSLVLAGSAGWHSAELSASIAELGLTDRVHRTGFVDDRDLPDLYRAAELFAMPSLDEGFGLPLLEAMGCGVPVLCSDAPAVQETVGDAACIVSPASVPQMTAALEQLLGDEQLRRSLREQGLARARSFSWSEAARRTIDVYRRALNR